MRSTFAKGADVQRRAKVRALVLAASGTLLIAACGWDPARPFERESPEVRRATAALDAGDATAATNVLEDYLNTGACADGQIGAPALLTKRSDGTFDLGLSLFRITESFGRRFGDEEVDAGVEDVNAKARGAQIECALRIVRTIAEDESVPLELRARARYLEGNLQFMGKRYEDAVKAYDLALTIAPGIVDAGDPVGRDAAWNRSLALRRKDDKDKNDGGGDGASDAKNDAPSDAKSDGASDSGNDGGDSGGDAGKDGGGEGGGGNDSGAPDTGADASQPPPPPPPTDTSDAGAPPPPQSNQDDRVLEQLERAPTVQQEAAKKAASQRRVRGMADK